MGAAVRLSARVFLAEKSLDQTTLSPVLVGYTMAGIVSLAVWIGVLAAIFA